MRDGHWLRAPAQRLPSPRTASVRGISRGLAGNAPCPRPGAADRAASNGARDRIVNLDRGGALGRWCRPEGVWVVSMRTRPWLSRETVRVLVRVMFVPSASVWLVVVVSTPENGAFFTFPHA